jgi:polysaccharide biosynthesis/export protein
MLKFNLPSKTNSTINGFKKLYRLKIFFFLGLVLVLTSCSKRNLVYFSDLGETEEYKTSVKNYTESKIQEDDLLDITVSSMNPESNLLFNPSPATSVAAAGASKGNEGYLVDKNGNVNFPVLGKVKLAGLTKNEAIDKMTKELQVHVKNPTVNIRFLNFKITVVGEVNRPSSFIIPTDKINIIEALGLAGDMTVYGKRENVLIVREKEGVRSTARVNLNNKSLLASPYFYLEQNDIVYVEPIKAKAAQASVTPARIGIVLSIISILSVFTVRFI